MHDMGSWNDFLVCNPKDQKTSSSKDEAEGASSFSFENEEKYSDEVEFFVKDSQEECSGLHLGGLQESSDCIETGVVSVLATDLMQGHHGDEDGRYNGSPTLVVSSQKKTDKIQNVSPYPKKRLLSSDDSNGRQRQFASTSGPLAPTPESLPKKTGNLSLDPQLQEQSRERVDDDGHALKRFRNIELSSEPRGAPVALGLQERVLQSPATGPSTFIRSPQVKGKKGGRKKPNRGNRSAFNSRTDLSAIEDDIETDSDDNDDVQKNVSAKGASGYPCAFPSLYRERHQEAVDLGPPLDTNPTSIICLNSKQAPSSFSERLRSVLKTLKSQQTQFQQSILSRHLLHDLSQCLVVLIMEKHLEAQLTVCYCKAVQIPVEWNDSTQGAATAAGNLDGLPMIEVLFSSKMSGDLELEEGRVVRVHPPWQEIHGAGNFGKIILGTFFCEMVE